MMAKHASVGVVIYKKKLIGMMQVFVMEVVQFHHVMYYFLSSLANSLRVYFSYFRPSFCHNLYKGGVLSV